MAGGKLTVRQKMINMMYLVLTALLALNVSAEILKAFHMVEVSMDRAGANLDKKNENTLKALAKYHAANPNDAVGTDAYNKSIQAQKIADDGVKYFQELKEKLISEVGGRKDGKADEEIAQGSNIEHHANYLIVQKHGEEVRKKIDDIKAALLNLVAADRRGDIKSDLSTEADKNAHGTWEEQMFEHTPIAAVVALLTKTQNDIKNTEAQVLDYLNSSITNDIVIVDQLEAKVIPNNGTYITLGSEYSADIFLAASSSRQQADIAVGGRAIKVENGVGKYTVNPSSEGEIEYSGVITTHKSNGKVETYPFKSSFTALKPLAVISATKMNVVYVGLDNPISVSVPGYSPKEINVTASSGNFRPDKQAGTYLLTPKDLSNREITISVSVNKNGKTTQMGIMKYRVRNVPKPTPMLGAIEQSGDVSTGQLRSVQFVFTALKDFAFEGVSFTPLSYVIIYQPKRGDAIMINGSGPALPPQAKAAFNNSRPGDRIILYNIKANGPAGAVIVPTSLALTVK